jgi:hypothetical protein
MPSASGVQVGDGNVQVNITGSWAAGPGVSFPHGGDAGPGGWGPAGWLLGEVTDAFALEVHRPVQPDGGGGGLPALTAYVPRGHDEALGAVARAAAEGSSGIAVLVGGSSTGKTRACWEALGPLREAGGWRLWHPIAPDRPEAVLRELPRVGPRTVVWLNEAQFYLAPPGSRLGERVAAGLRELLRDPARAPVLVLATVWPRFWDVLTARPAGGGDRHPQARELLAGHDLPVPQAFTAGQAGRLRQAGDPRLDLAARLAPDGEVTQFLAGAPELLARYRNAPPAARAMIAAAMDARRLGAGPALPQAFLEAAAPGYLTGSERDALDDDWAEQALAYAAVPCKGAGGPLARIRLPAGSAVPPGTAAPWRLADYLDQHGRVYRAALIPPAGFWASAAAHASVQDQAALGAAAGYRGLYRAAAQLHKNAAVAGDRLSAAWLALAIGCADDDPRPAAWAVAHASLSDPQGVAELLGYLRYAGAHEQVAVLLARGPAVHADLSDPSGVARLLDSLRKAGAYEQVAVLLARGPAVHVDLSDPSGVARLLDSLIEAGAGAQATALARRAAGHADHADALSVATLVDSLCEAGAHEQAAALASRAAGHADPTDIGTMSTLVFSLEKAGARREAAALAGLAADCADPTDAPDAAALVSFLRTAGAHEQAAALASRAAEHADLSLTASVADLLRGLLRAGADEEAAVLLARDPAAHADLRNPSGVAKLLDSLIEADAWDQADKLAGRDLPACTDLNRTFDVVQLLRSLNKAHQHEVAEELAGRAAECADLSFPYSVAKLLDYLLDHNNRDGADAILEYGPGEQVEALLARDPAASADVIIPFGVPELLNSLQAAEAWAQAGELASRLPAAGLFAEFLSQEQGEQFPYGQEPDGTPATPWTWEDLDLPVDALPESGHTVV